MVRAEIARMDPALPLVTPVTMEQTLNNSDAVFRRRSVLTLLAGFAVATLILAVVGVYGVLAQTVAQRTREVAVRVALGATGSSIATSVVRRSFTAVVAGLAVGLAASLALSRTLDTLLFATQATDPLAFGTAGVVLAVAAGAACVLPIRRALAIDPAGVLRNQ
jgi:ABC-type antimicrobial peptide transport system permease subunit